MREKEIRLSESEHEQLKNYKIEEYDSTVPFGYVIGELLDQGGQE
jgi:hypothetical protein